jgi:4,5-DOPA dioxygenase extradiol
MLPTLFLSHGSPMTVLEDTPARHFLETLGSLFPRPKAILAISAHWETATPQLSAPAQNTTIHDFYGFPAALYAMRYNAPPAPELAAQTRDLLAAAGFPASIDTTRGLDHGAWPPLALAYPQADIPVLQLSVQTQLGAAHHLALGAALTPLRAQDILILGSGSFTHDLRRFRHAMPPLNAPETPDVTEFSAWMNREILAANLPALANYRTLAPYAADQHPTEEHILPLHAAIAAAGPTPTTTHLHSSVENGFLRMDAYAFN